MSRIDHRDIYERLWKGRDFEIKHLWQRSIFLATFLVMVFTAYCGLWASFISSMNDNDDGIIVVVEHDGNLSNKEIARAIIKDEDSKDVIEVLDDGNHLGISFCFLVLSCVGCVFSLLWIFMAKGSKCWYERYESSIDYMHDHLDNFKKDVADEWRREELQAMLDWRWPMHEPIQGHLRQCEIHQSIYSRSGAAYSMSKVNVFIGQFFYLLWFAASVFHLTFIIPCKIANNPCARFLVAFAIDTVFWVLIVECLKLWLAGWGYEKHQGIVKHSILFSYIDRVCKYRKYTSSLIETYKVHSNSMIGKWNDNQCFKQKKYKLDELIGHHLKYDDIHRLELFLREYDASRFFPEEFSGDWKDSLSSRIITFPIQDSDVYKFISSDSILDKKHSLHCFADIDFIPTVESDVAQKNKMVCIIADISGDLSYALEFTYVNREGYSPVLEYQVVYGDGSFGKQGYLLKE